MIDQETRDALIAVCETLKAEFRYLAALQGQLAWLDDAVRKAVPQVMTVSKEPFVFQEHPGTVAQIRLIDALLEKLRREQV